ncbi:MAG TPA: toll/interleukin-1 receptor domain-containing protein [Bacteroidia bacterium]|nr:toll/interleukin-1 receptor domain-containing protein [Bacteroidia bacterium]
MAETPKIFISYSWTTPTHEDWVINLAERLVSDGVDVTIDKWHLKEGHDKFAFMESMVKSSDINKVLIILDKKYSEKADARSGGVGNILIKPFNCSSFSTLKSCSIGNISFTFCF